MRNTQEILQEAEALRARSAALLVRCDDLAREKFHVRGLVTAAEARTAQVTAERNALEARLAEVLVELSQCKVELTHARAIIDLMERSWFWRARLIWVRLRRIVLAVRLL